MRYLSSQVFIRKGLVLKFHNGHSEQCILSDPTPQGIRGRPRLRKNNNLVAKEHDRAELTFMVHQMQDSPKCYCELVRGAEVRHAVTLNSCKHGSPITTLQDESVTRINRNTSRINNVSHAGKRNVTYTRDLELCTPSRIPSTLVRWRY